MKVPVHYSPEVAAEVCRLLANGTRLSGMAASPDLPSRAAVRNWVRKYPQFRRAYMLAREAWAAELAEETLEIADTEPNPQRARVRIQHRRWMAAAIHPEEWGEWRRLDVTVHQRTDFSEFHRRALAKVVSEAQARLGPPAEVDPFS